jgi:predicted nucleic acid-binding protein
LSGRDSRIRTLLADTDLFFFYLRGGKLEREAEAVIAEAVEGNLTLKTSTEVYDDAILALRSGGLPLEDIGEFISDMRSIPHTALPMNAQIASDALSTYIGFGGRSRLSYFDSFHIATAKSSGLTMLTSDGFIKRNSSRLGVRVLDLASWGK